MAEISGIFFQYSDSQRPDEDGAEGVPGTAGRPSLVESDIAQRCQHVDRPPAGNSTQVSPRHRKLVYMSVRVQEQPEYAQAMSEPCRDSGLEQPLAIAITACIQKPCAGRGSSVQRPHCCPYALPCSVRLSAPIGRVLWPSSIFA